MQMNTQVKLYTQPQCSRSDTITGSVKLAASASKLGATFTNDMKSRVADSLRTPLSKPSQVSFGKKQRRQSRDARKEEYGCLWVECCECGKSRRFDRGHHHNSIALNWKCGMQGAAGLEGGCDTKEEPMEDGEFEKENVHMQTQVTSSFLTSPSLASSSLTSSSLASSSLTSPSLASSSLTSPSLASSSLTSSSLASSSLTSSSLASSSLTSPSLTSASTAAGASDGEEGVAFSSFHECPGDDTCRFCRMYEGVKLSP